MPISFRPLRKPLQVLGVLWPLALLLPFVTGIPQPLPKGLPWRQELVFALLLCVTSTLLTKQLWKDRLQSFSLRRNEFHLSLPLLLFTVWSAVSCVWATNAYPALHHTFVWTAYLIFFLVARRIAGDARSLRLSIAVLAFVVLTISVACMAEFWGSAAQVFQRVGYGEPLAIAIPLLTALALGLRRRRAAWLTGITAVAAWLAILQMMQRAAFLGACAGLLTLVAAMFIFPHWRPRSFRRALLLLAAFVLASVLQNTSSLTGGRPSAIDRIQTTNATDRSSSIRLMYWGVGLEILRAHPVFGVGANNYEVDFAQGRAQFSARYANSSLITLSEEFLAERAHNEYVQMLTELGVVGFSFFLGFCIVLMLAALRALRRSRSFLALGASGSLLTFLVSSGASSGSFRWMGSGLLFFFAAGIISRLAPVDSEQGDFKFNLTPTLARVSSTIALLFACLMLCGTSTVAANSILHARAQMTLDPTQALALFRQAMWFNPYDAGTRFDYGIRLFYERQADEAVPHLRYAVERGLNASVCYAYLAAAEAGAGDIAASERTLAYAVSVYPRSVFLRARHASALADLGNSTASVAELQAALAIDAKAARGWWRLLRVGIDAIKREGQTSEGVALPGDLQPENCVIASIAEFERKPTSESAAIDTDAHH
ncbi:MAG: O-antigen ligase family protein [Pyrinomonadaceae bacterium]|nr:O-antigen ligase family protein [Pyrinomonadaceae bacterium]